jgi:hypothetical protein
VVRFVSPTQLYLHICLPQSWVCQIWVCSQSAFQITR